jgi:hypothetical protein
MKNLNQQLNKLTLSNDWIYNRLQAKYDQLDKQLNIKVDDSNGFFAVAIAYQQAADKKQEISNKMQRIFELILKRSNQIEKRRKALINSLTINEQEQLIIA